MKLSEYVKNYRKEHDLSQRQLSERCDLTHSYICLIEKEINSATGKVMIPSIETLNKLAAGMNTTLTNLLQTVDNMPISINGKGNLEIVGNSELHEKLVKLINRLNDHGLSRLNDLAEDLILIEKYQKV